MPYEGVQGTPPPVRERKAAAPKRASGKVTAREEAANGVFQLAGYGLLIAGQYADAGAIGNHGPAIAHELASVAEQDARLAKGLDSLLEVGPYGNLIIVMMPLVLQLMANHGILKPEALGAAGVVHPQALTAEVKAQMARQAADAVRAQREAESELARVQQEMRDDYREYANGSSAFDPAEPQT